jgi:putative ABC transport system substrate-binding protein
MPVIGFLNATSPESNSDRLRGFHRGLRESGYVEGENVPLGRGGNDRLPELAADLVQHQVSVIAPLTAAAAFAVKAATAAIPIVFAVNEDPVRLGLVNSLARPGGNATGINFLTAEVAAKRLNLLRELVPGARRVGVLVNPANATSTESTLKDVATAASTIGLETRVLNAGTGSEINAAFATFASEKPDPCSLPATRSSGVLTSRTTGR